MLGCAEYIWLDGDKPTQQLRSKTRIVEINNPELVSIDDFPKWSYDGSSCNQASGDDSDLILEPCNVVPDPIRGIGNYLVLCEVHDARGGPHETNQRAKLRQALEEVGGESDPWFGFEQEYTLYQGHCPLGWPEDGYPGPQGPFYCGVGADRVFGREIVEEHTAACLEANLAIYGTNAEVMPGQWEFQIGYRGVDSDQIDALNLCDHLWLARWLLHRIAEDSGVVVSLDNKPVPGDWNGAGCHTNFSTSAMRNPQTGQAAIDEALERLSKTHEEHVRSYGAGLEERLTGLHETCSINEFRSGVADRGCSIRIPLQVAQKGYGYIEDRRPGANMDPYVVAEKLIRTVCQGCLEPVSS